jgi:oligopeptide/dipeptide ABC transporter ATP-binding protein
MSILRAQDIYVTFQLPGGSLAHAVRGAGLALEAGEILGVLGESGSGKSTLARVLAGACLKNSKCSGTMFVDGREYACSQTSKARSLSAGIRKVSFVSQHPSLALNPYQRIRTQLAELLAANGVVRALRPARALELLAVVRLKDPPEIAASYPHELSGGEKQRVAIALALASSPKVLVCDEATGSVDPTTEASLMKMFLSLRGSHKLAIVWVTHNPSQLRDFANRVAVMYAGRIVETGSVEQVLDAPLHPYTAALIRCAKRDVSFASGEHRERLAFIPGAAPDVTATFVGCSFAERCADHRGACDRACPGTIEVEASREVECVIYG